MSSTVDPSNDTAPVPHPGWLVVDPTDHPYAWYSAARSGDVATTMALLEPDATLREDMLRCGWSIRVGAGTELFERDDNRARATA